VTEFDNRNPSTPPAHVARPAGSNTASSRIDYNYPVVQGPTGIALGGGQSTAERTLLTTEFARHSGRSSHAPVRAHLDWGRYKLNESSTTRAAPSQFCRSMSVLVRRQRPYEETPDTLPRGGSDKQNYTPGENARLRIERALAPADAPGRHRTEPHFVRHYPVQVSLPGGHHLRGARSMRWGAAALRPLVHGPVSVRSSAPGPTAPDPRLGRGACSAFDPALLTLGIPDRRPPEKVERRAQRIEVPPSGSPTCRTRLRFSSPSPPFDEGNPLPAHGFQAANSCRLI